MRKLLAGLICAAMFVAYLATPFVSAFQIRQAVRNGDVDLLENLVEWPQVRESLKSSIASLDRAKRENAMKHGMPQPSLWERIKAAAMPVDTLIDRYVTPAGVVQMNAARQTWKSVTASATAVKGSTSSTVASEAVDPIDSTELSRIERFVRFYKQVKRAEFLSLTKIELEVADRKVPERRYVGTMEFRGIGWKLTDLQVVGKGF
jgi:Protein of unknown function (DUF2939)